MPLAAGTKLGPYEVIAPLGAGGMGEVYRARDTRLSRDVAIKVLPASLSSSPESRARFEREAKTVSSLNHPHICTLHDVGREGDTDYLVMELVEGETLAQRLAKGALPAADVLKLGGQIADALDRAHRAGVVHRDLKPGNVMLTKSGAKLMDFGLARATGMAGAASGSGMPQAALTQSPTVAAPLTAEGTIIGTFQYMSPEQLEGREADARSDIWALGCVLYEMATGKPPFEGRSQASLITSIMSSEPAPISKVSALAPPALDRVVGACLAKDPDERIQTAHDVKLQLGWLTGEGSQTAVGPAPVRRRRASQWAPWAFGVVGLLVAAAALWLARDRQGPVIRAIIPQPANALFLFFGDNSGPPVISPDGRQVAFVAVDAERGARLWVRDVASLTARPLAGTENATYPFWSPDSRSLGFFADLRLKRVDVATGQVFGICPVGYGRGGTWNRRGQIVFSPDFQSDLAVVPAMGGTPRRITTRDTLRHTTHRWPEFLPDDRRFLYFAGNHANVNGPENELWVGSVDGRENRMLLPAATEAHYADGFLFYVQDSVLMARAFDPGSLRFRGEAIPTAERVQFDPTTWKANFSLSRAGLLVYQPIGGRQGSQIRLLDRTGRVLKIAGESGNHFNVRFSPGARGVVYSSQLLPNGDIFAYDFDREITRRLTQTEDDDDLAVCSPDGQLVAYCSLVRSDRIAGPRHYSILVAPFDAIGAPRRLYRGPRDVWPLDWSDDGRMLLIGTGNLSSILADSIGVLDVHDPPTVRWLASPPGPISCAGFSHDGRWVAYGTGGVPEPQVFIEPVPALTGSAAPRHGARLQVSSHGGGIPRWRGDDRELYFARPDGMIVAVPLAAGTLQPGRETDLFRAILRPSVQATLDASRDGQRFLVNVLASEGAAPIVLVSGWKQALMAR
jgi:Tol biopolymer transport system component